MGKALEDAVSGKTSNGEDCYVITHIVRFHTAGWNKSPPQIFTYTFDNEGQVARWKKDMQRLIDGVSLTADSGSQIQEWRMWLLQYDAMLSAWEPKMLPELTQMADDAEAIIEKLPTKLDMREALQDYVAPTKDERDEFLLRWVLQPLSLEVVFAMQNGSEADALISAVYQSEYLFGGKFKQTIAHKGRHNYYAWGSNYRMIRALLSDDEETLGNIARFYGRFGTNKVPNDMRQIYGLLMEKFGDEHIAMQEATLREWEP